MTEQDLLSILGENAQSKNLTAKKTNEIMQRDKTVITGFVVTDAYGNIGIVAVEDVTKCMIQLMKSSINGERYTLVGENISAKILLDFIAEELKLKKPTIEASKWMTSLAWRMDWLISKLLNRKRKLTRSTANASHTTSPFNTSKIECELNFTFQKKESYLKTILKLNQEQLN